MRILLSLSLASLFLPSCQITDSATGPQADARRMQIAAEPPGDYFVGRRFFIERTHFWGYLRRPGQSWSTAKLVLLNERSKLAPDRLPEIPDGPGRAHGFDHNHEYMIWGRYSGRRVYDPNSNLMISEFELTNYRLINASPGWLFKPTERFNGSQLLRDEPDCHPR